MTINLSLIKVELATDYFDREYANDLLSRHHPLAARKAIGKRLCYMAKYRGEVVAVLLFDNAVARNKMREDKIGWDKDLAEKRRKHVANNTRYLILPEYCGQANLASKVLSLSTERVSRDWFKQYGVPLLALETYVDPEHNDNNGACYTAAGWENLGYSSGYQAPETERTHSKWYFLKPLHADSYSVLRSPFEHTLLTGAKGVTGESNNNFVFNWTEVKLRDLQEHLASIKDPRKKHGKVYPFAALLTLCQAAVFSGYTQYRQIADWISKLPPEIRVKFGIRADRMPTESTIGKFLSRINPEELEKCQSAWIKKNHKKAFDSKVVSLDGKNLRGTSSIAQEQIAFLNVFANDTKVLIAQLPTNKGAGEKATARLALETYAVLENKTILADAIHTDKAMIEALKKKTARMSSLLKAIKEI